MRGTTRIAGATTLGTIGLAAGVATGDLKNAMVGLTGGVAAGNKLGRNLVDGGINLANRIVDKNGNEDIKRYNSLVEKNPEKTDTIKEFINAGITDTRKIEKALKKPYDVKKSLAYMKMAEKCPSNVLYNEEKFKDYLLSYGIREEQADEIRKEVVSFLD